MFASNVSGCSVSCFFCLGRSSRWAFVGATEDCGSSTDADGPVVWYMASRRAKRSRSRGEDWNRLSKSSRQSVKQRVGISAMTVAVRVRSSISAHSPKLSPSPSVRSSCSCPFTSCTTRTRPDRIMNSASACSPSRISVAPAGNSRRSRRSSNRVTSFDLRVSSTVAVRRKSRTARSCMNSSKYRRTCGTSATMRSNSDRSMRNNTESSAARTVALRGTSLRIACSPKSSPTLWVARVTCCPDSLRFRTRTRPEKTSHASWPTSPSLKTVSPIEKRRSSMPSARRLRDSSSNGEKSDSLRRNGTSCSAAKSDMGLCEASVLKHS